MWSLMEGTEDARASCHASSYFSIYKAMMKSYRTLLNFADVLENVVTTRGK